jgi:DNA-binding transcriptional LysR family regulator
VSQPAVSRALSSLRRDLNDPLLVRSGHGMELTSRAQNLALPLAEWMATTSALLQAPDFDPRTLKRRFRIASTDFGVTAVVAPALTAISKQAPGVGIDVSPFTPDMVARMVSGEIDLIVTGLEPDRALTYDRLLFTDSFSVLARAGHPLAGLTEPMSIDAFLEWPHITLLVSDREFDRVNHVLGPRAAERNIVASLPYFHAAPRLIGASDAIMTLPTRAAAPLAREHGLSLLEPPRMLGRLDYWLLWHERNRRDPATQWLCDVIAKACA